MNERYKKNNRFNDENSGKKKKEPLTEMEILKYTSCRTTVKGVHYNGRLRSVMHFQNIYVPCLSWSLFDVNLYIK